MLIYSNFNLKAAWTEGAAVKQSPGEKGERWPFTPAGAGTLTTSIALFNFNPLINRSNHTSPSSGGENTPPALVHFLEGVCCKREGKWNIQYVEVLQEWTHRSDNLLMNFNICTSTCTIYGRVLGPPQRQMSKYNFENKVDLLRP